MQCPDISDSNELLPRFDSESGVLFCSAASCDVYVSGHAAYRESAHGLILTELCSGGGLGWPNNFGQLSEKKKCDNGLLYPPYPAKLRQGEDHLFKMLTMSRGEIVFELEMHAGVP